MQTKVQRWGNSLAVRIPKPLAEMLRMADGSPVELWLEHGELHIRALDPVVRSLEALLAGVTPENLHEETSTGTTRGKETW